MLVKKNRLVKRFLRYVKIDTQSKEGVDNYPSTNKQKKLAKILVKELKEIGIKKVEIDKYSYVYATIPANTKKNIPVWGLIAHLDTAPNISGKNVKPIIHKNYQGEDIDLGEGVVISKKENKILRRKKGEDIISSNGKTLLGADDKAGVAEIMEFANILMENKEIKHSEIRIAFTLDEEVGRGVDFFNLNKFKAQFAYTIDGGSIGEIEDENFCADSAKVFIYGLDIHPGYAKNKMINALRVASWIIDSLPKKDSPEKTEKREGYIHPYNLKANVEKAEIDFIFRDFEEKKLQEKIKLFQNIIKKAKNKYTGVKIDVDLKKNYRNMKFILDKHPYVLEYVKKACKKSNIKSITKEIRGGTDGARLSFMGLPTPNLFTGGHNFHSRTEWISVQDMQKTVEMLLNLNEIITLNK